MFEDLSTQFKGLFGPLGKGMCRISVNGNIAVFCRNSNTYKTYDVAKGTLTNVSNFSFSMDEMFMVVPTQKANVGDIILIDGKPKCVIKVDNKIITVIDYDNSEIRQVVPERHIFMGNTYFYGKIVCLFGNMLKKNHGLGGMVQFMAMQQLMGGNSNNFGQLMAMSMMMGDGKDNPLSNMFNFDLDDESAEENDGKTD